MPKVIAISDLHSELELMEYFFDFLEEIYSEFDYLFITGDISDNDILPLNFFENYLRIQSKLFYVFGNNDNDRFRHIFSRDIKTCVDNNVVKRNDKIIGGLGGSLPTSFRTPNEFTEENYLDLLKKFDNIKIDFFLLHNPPKGFFDNVKNNHIGSKSILEFLKLKNDLRVCLFGHVHEHEGYQFFNNKLMIKVPCFLMRRYCVLEFDDFDNVNTFKVSFKSF
ncbi:MAG: metallophosphoesterase [Candidatus Anstonellales archaeon]